MKHEHRSLKRLFGRPKLQKRNVESHSLSLYRDDLNMIVMGKI